MMKKEDNKAHIEESEGHDHALVSLIWDEYLIQEGVQVAE